MASESVKILIEAEDKASAQVASATKSIESNVKSVKETGTQAKGSIEFIGVLAGQLGGDKFASAAQGVAGITEKVGQFSEVMKTGGAGAIAFQSGIAILVTTLSFNLGKSLGEAIFKVKDMSAEFARVNSEAEKYAQTLASLSTTKFGEKIEDLSFIRDPKAQINAAYDVQQSIQKDLQTALGSYIAYQDQVDAIRKQEAESVLGISAAESERANELQRQANAQVAVIDALQGQQAALNKQFGPRAQQLQLLRQQQQAEEQLAAKRKAADDSALSSLRNINYQYLELTKGREASRRQQLQDQGIGESDIKRILFAEQALEAQKKLDEAKKKAQQEEENRLQKVADLRKSELSRLEEQRVLLEQGEKAAHVFRLTQQGLDKDTAEAIANAQAASDEAMKARQIQPTQPIAATESRLLSRGPRQDKMDEVAKNTKLTADQSIKFNEAIGRLQIAIEKDKQAKKDSLAVKVIT